MVHRRRDGDRVRPPGRRSRRDAGDRPVRARRGRLTRAAAGSEEQLRALLPGVAAGTTILTPARRELAPTTYAGGTVTGRKIGVTYADKAARLLVTASSDEGPVVALVDPSGPGVTLLPSSSREQQLVHDNVQPQLEAAAGQVGVAAQETVEAVKPAVEEAVVEVKDDAQQAVAEVKDTASSAAADVAEEARTGVDEVRPR